MKKILSIILTLSLLISAFSFVASVSANDYDTSQFVERKGWKISASCAKQPYNGSLNLIDGRTDTFWHSDYVEEGGTITSKTEPPYEITVTLPEATTISGFGMCPRSGNLTGNITAYEFYYTKGDDDAWLLVNTGSFTNEWSPKYVRFAENITVKKVKFVITASHNNFGVFTEFDLLKEWNGSDALPNGSKDTVKVLNTPAGGKAGTNLSRKGWKVTASDSKHYNQPGNMIDGKADTYWHSDYEDDGTTVTSNVPCPHEIVITIPEVKDVSALKILPRSGNPTGLIKSYELYVSESDADSWILVKSGSLPTDYNEKTIEFGKALKTKKVRLVITESDKGFGVISEINLVEGDGSASSGAAEAPKADTAEFVSRKGWEAKASSEHNKDLRGARLFDGDTNSYWHSAYQSDGANITGQDSAPFYVVAKFPTDIEFSGFRYTPRVDNNTGTVLGYEIFVMDSDTSAKLVKSGKMELSKNATSVDFGFNVKGTGVVFKVTEGLHGYGTGSELDLMTAKGGNSLKKSDELANKNTDLVISELSVTSDPSEAAKAKLNNLVKKTGWKAEVSSEFHQNRGEYAIDGNDASFWHSYYKAEGSSIVDYATLPHSLTVTLPEETVVSGFCYTPRGEAGGRLTGYELYGAVGDGELQLIMAGEFANNSDKKFVEFPANIALTKVMLKLVATSGGKYGVVAEFDLMSKNDEKETAASIAELYKLIDGEKLVPIAKTGFVATATSGESSAMRAIDGMGTSTVWHSNASKQYDFPITYSVDMGKVYTLSYLQYSPRGGDAEMIGYWTDFDVFVSEDGNDWEQVVSHGTVELTQNKISLIEFTKTANVRYMDIEIYNGNHGYAVCGELDFLVPKKELDAIKKNNYYKLQIGSNKVTTVKDGVETVKEIDVAPYIMNGSTLIPLRGLLEEMGATFTWDGERRKIGITKDDTQIEMQIFNNLVYVTDKIYGKVRYTLAVVPQIKDSRTFVPVRFISEQLGYEVVWEAETQSIYIY